MATSRRYHRECVLTDRAVKYRDFQNEVRAGRDNRPVRARDLGGVTVSFGVTLLLSH